MSIVPAPGTHHPDLSAKQADEIRKLIDDRVNTHTIYYLKPEAEEDLWVDVLPASLPKPELGALNVQRAGNTFAMNNSRVRVRQTWRVAINEDHWVASSKVLTEVEDIW